MREVKNQHWLEHSPSHLIASEDFAVSSDDYFARAVDAHLPLQFEKILRPAIVDIHQFALTTHTRTRCIPFALEVGVPVDVSDWKLGNPDVPAQMKRLHINFAYLFDI